MAVATSNATRRRVITVGSAVIDTITALDSETIEKLSIRHGQKSYVRLERGRKIAANSIEIHAGGGGLNSAVCFSRLGYDTATVVKLGIDSHASRILEVLRREEIDCQFVVQTDVASTGASVFISAGGNDPTIFTFRGANSLITKADLDRSAFDADIVYISSLSDASADCYPEIVQLARANGAFVASNPGIRQLTSRSNAFVTSLADLDMLTMNVVEAEALATLLSGEAVLDLPDTLVPAVSSNQPLLERGLATESGPMSLPQFFSICLRRGCGCVVVTDGGDGAYAATSEGIVYCPAVPTQVAGTAGAGDAFNATFAAFLSSGVGVTVALQLASSNAASVVGFTDTQRGLLSYDRLLNVWSINQPLLTTAFWSLGGSPIPEPEHHMR